ncbi:MAG: hypothetical protein HYX48_00950 [Chlamydiales bacterium]|nr:hypothetical protein [Chlamydiales bacterium]
MSLSSNWQKHLVLSLVFCSCTIHAGLPDPAYLPEVETESVIRAAIDVGSAGPKLRVAQVDLANNKIVNLLHAEQYPVFYQASLAQSSDRILSSEIIKESNRAFEQAIAKARSFGADRVVAVATSAFRNAANGHQVADDIQKSTGVKVHIADQNDEGKLAFQAAAARVDAKAEDLIVWDIGGGSTQFITVNPDGTYHIDCSKDGSWAFKNLIIQDVHHQSVDKRKSPNPMSAEEIITAKRCAGDLSDKINPFFKDKASKASTKIIGVGSVFGTSIIQRLNGKNPFTVEDLAAVIKDLTDKSDEDLGGGNFAFVEVSNVILVLGFMERLNIHEMSIIDVNIADGAMLYRPLWDDDIQGN